MERECSMYCMEWQAASWCDHLPIIIMWCDLMLCNSGVTTRVQRAYAACMAVANVST